MTRKYIARFHNVKGRYLVENEGGGLFGAQCLGGQKIIGAPGTAAYRRQTERYHNRPDPETGLMLDESYRTFSARELVSLRPAPSA